MTAKRGLFWYVDGELLCFPVSGDEADTVSNNHRRFWKTLPHSLTGGMSYNYFPRGRVELRHGKALVYLHPTLCTPGIDIRIRHAFSLPAMRCNCRSRPTEVGTIAVFRRNRRDEHWTYPTPFHSGDIVCSRFSTNEPFVLTDMVTWGSERMMKELPPSEYDRQVLDCADWTVERLLKQGDSRIMGAFGYRAEGNLIRREKAPICDYLDLEYYRGSLDSSHKILQPVSTYLKGNCGIEFLLNAYCLLRQSTLPGQAE